MTARIAIVGAGLAGSVLAWRLARAGATVTVYGGPGPDPTPGPRRAVGPGPAAGPGPWGLGGPAPDATAVSGGLTRAFETDPGLCRLAAESLAELLADPALAAAAQFRRTGSTYVLAGPEDLDRPLKELEERLPGAVTVVDRTGLPGWHGLPPDAVAVLEPRAGFLSPDALRRFALAGLDRRPAPPDPTGLTGHDAVVLATGRWTPRVLTTAGLPGPFRTKAVQYGLHPAPGWTPGVFVDETTGLWGRPAGDGLVLLGVPADRWDLDPDRPEPDPALVARSVRAARDRFGVAVGAPVRVVAAADAYGDPPVLALRPVPGRPGLHTFTGGSGGAAKYALAAARAAATTLLD